MTPTGPGLDFLSPGPWLFTPHQGRKMHSHDTPAYALRLPTPKPITTPSNRPTPPSPPNQLSLPPSVPPLLLSNSSSTSSSRDARGSRARSIRRPPRVFPVRFPLHFSPQIPLFVADAGLIARFFVVVGCGWGGGGGGGGSGGRGWGWGFAWCWNPPRSWFLAGISVVSPLVELSWFALA